MSHFWLYRSWKTAREAFSPIMKLLSSKKEVTRLRIYLWGISPSLLLFSSSNVWICLLDSLCWTGSQTSAYFLGRQRRGVCRPAVSMKTDKQRSPRTSGQSQKHTHAKRTSSSRPMNYRFNWVCVMRSWFERGHGAGSKRQDNQISPAKDKTVIRPQKWLTWPHRML